MSASDVDDDRRALARIDADLGFIAKEVERLLQRQEHLTAERTVIDSRLSRRQQAAVSTSRGSATDVQGEGTHSKSLSRSGRTSV